MAADPTLAQVLGPIDPAMIVLTTAAGDERAGCLVGFHCQCSIDPGRYAVWLSKANHTFRIALLADHFAVHFLGDGDHDVAELFGTTSGDDVDKFTRCEWTPGTGGVPLLDRVERRVTGRKHTLLDDGSDHVCLVLDRLQAGVGGGADDFAPLRLQSVADLEAGHEAEDRQRP